MCLIDTARTRTIFIALVIAGALLAVVPDTPAQTRAVTDEDWRHGTTLAAFVGGASPFSGVDPAVGASLGWEITPRIGVEGRGTWFPAPEGMSAFAAAIGTRVGFGSTRPILPFVSAGVGLYRATFDAAATGAMPRFYRQRMGENMSLGETFDDFMVSLGGGAEVFVSQHIALRPELTMLLVTTRSDVRTVPQFGVSMTYHFQSNRIAP